MTKIRNQAYLNKFGKRIAELRRERGLSQYQLSYESDISRSQIIRIENGEVNTTLSTVHVLANTFGLTPSELLDIKD